MANIGIKPSDKVLQKGITRIQKLVDELRLDLNSEVKTRKSLITSESETTGSASTIPTEITQYIEQTVIDGVVAHSQLTGVSTDDHHARDHDISTHDTTATGAELNTLTGGTDASALHTHTIVSLDTDATGAELNSLTTEGTEVGGDMHIHDGRYYTKTLLNAGQLDNQYYTETELNAGQLNNQYYTETELNAGQLDNQYRTETELSATTDGSGADFIGIYDAGSIITATTVADALQENRVAIDAIEDNGISVTGNNGITISTNSGTIGADNLTIALNADVDGTSIVNDEGTGAQIGIKDAGVDSEHYAIDSIDTEHINWGIAGSEISAVDIPIADTGTLTSRTEVEGYLAENRTAIDVIEAKAIVGGNGIASTGTIVGTQNISVELLPLSGLGFAVGQLSVVAGRGMALNALLAGAVEVDLATDSGMGFSDASLTAKLAIGAGDGIAISGGTTAVDLASTNPCLEFTDNKLDAKINTSNSNKRLLKEADGIAIDESIIPTWSAVHTHTAWVKCLARLLVTGGDIGTTTGGVDFPIAIRTVDDDGRMLFAGGDDMEHQYSFVGGHELHGRDYDLDFDRW